MLSDLWTHLANLLLSVTAVLLAYAVYIFVKDFSAATGTIWQRLLAASRQSSTYLWAKIVGASAYVGIWLDQASAFLNMPEVQAIIQKTVTPTRAGVFVLVAMVVTAIARLRHIVMDKLAELRAPPSEAASS